MKDARRISFLVLAMIVALLVNPEAGTAYLGMQGDVWDAQKDMLMDTLGAVASLLLYLMLHGRRAARA